MFTQFCTLIFFFSIKNTKQTRGSWDLRSPETGFLATRSARKAMIARWFNDKNTVKHYFFTEKTNGSSFVEKLQ